MDPFDYLLDVENNRLLSSLLDFENTPPLKSGSQESKHCSVTDDDSEPTFYQGQNLVDTTLLDTSALKESILKQAHERTGRAREPVKQTTSATKGDLQDTGEVTA
ncbi:PREDICTED: uncharacterized protein LOC106821227 [Priapulus caudatus]|uniref:Uncharacterized protein LOC106821227 n=1 Tax=Priapulus caudatus TaxID=37621 RepID=A0ABM1FAF0_PRICU|nr:PREDICTED: uncharacterized protein LOC106821227 [Priapulus caudatus]XP_014681423.1 PREDICTED: uncharacterized protein LOC106821227 [Priapulus caudatus]XP_014681424.1 PREDICTED: uncharacterized protein LOC106821227 [Priapulus caudatus]XP_014681425.1 PREDICTED: uncharacterized protein LOC106821227 [Priapulus caudatus]